MALQVDSYTYTHVCDLCLLTYICEYMHKYLRGKWK